jgi:hypothetical protein
VLAVSVTVDSRITVVSASIVVCAPVVVSTVVASLVSRGTDVAGIVVGVDTVADVVTGESVPDGVVGVVALLQPHDNVSLKHHPKLLDAALFQMQPSALSHEPSFDSEPHDTAAPTS